MSNSVFRHLKKPVLLDGGMGRELRFRGVEILDTIWSANALLVAPEVVRQVHLDYIKAGAEIITTNTYGVIRDNLKLEGVDDRFEELNELACQLACEAREISGRNVLIAGSIPPLKGSYRPDLVPSSEEMIDAYSEQARVMAPFVDFFLCETMSAAEEGRCAATACVDRGKPVWVSWTLHEDRSGRLRSGETVEEAFHALNHVKVDGVLVNCCAPESITSAIPQLLRTGVEFTGGYANTFNPIPEDWMLDNEEHGFVGLRDDLDPDQYVNFVKEWLDLGATVVGGCCGTRPAHIARINKLISSME